MANRYALKGRRPGERHITPVGDITFHAIDGGAALNDAQLEYFRNDGIELIKVASRAPSAELDPVKAIHDHNYEAAVAEARAAGASGGLSPEEAAEISALQHGSLVVPGAAEIVAAAKAPAGAGSDAP